MFPSIRANQLTGFYMMATLVVKGLISEAKFGDDSLGFKKEHKR